MRVHRVRGGRHGQMWFGASIFRGEDPMAQAAQLSFVSHSRQRIDRFHGPELPPLAHLRGGSTLWQSGQNVCLGLLQGCSDSEVWGTVVRRSTSSPSTLARNQERHEGWCCPRRAACPGRLALLFLCLPAVAMCQSFEPKGQHAVVLGLDSNQVYLAVAPAQTSLHQSLLHLGGACCTANGR